MEPLGEPKEHCKCPMCGQNQYDNGETGLDNPEILRHAFNALLPRCTAYPKLVDALKKLIIKAENSTDNNTAENRMGVRYSVTDAYDLLTELGEL
jgi:hypothetical protein